MVKKGQTSWIRCTSVHRDDEKGEEGNEKRQGVTHLAKMRKRGKRKN